MGNICRSPTAHGVFRQKVEEAGLLDLIEIDSAGTHAYHIGEAPDHRSQQAALERGFDLSDLKARKIDFSDFSHHDYYLVMDHSNMSDVMRECPEEYKGKVKLFLDYAIEYDEDEVPDPYYGGARGFTHVLDLVESASEGLLRVIREDHRI